MANNNRIRIDIDGDSSGLQRALAEATRELDNFGSNAGGAVQELTNSFGGLAAKFSTSMTGIGAAAAVGIGGLTSLVNTSREYVAQLNEVARISGLSVTELQQLQTAFSGLGVSVEKFGDINKDALDHLGDAFRSGGSIADDLKEWGVNLQSYNKYLNQTDGGLKAVVQTFYTMRDAGKSQAEIVNVMESLASDSSHLITVLDQFNNAADATNYIQSQNAAVTDETAASYARFEKNLSTLTTQAKSTIAEGLSPLVDAINGVLEAANAKPKDTGVFDELNKKIKESKGSLQDVYDIWQKLRTVGALNYQGAALRTGSLETSQESLIRNLQEQAAQLQQDLKNVDPQKAAPKGGFVDTGKQAAAAKAAADKAAAAKKAADAKRLQAERTLQNALTQVGEDSAQIRLQQFDRQQKALIDSIMNSAKVLGISPDQLKKYVDSANASGATKRNDLVNSLIGYSDPNQGINQTNSLIQNGNLNDTQKNFLAQQQNQRINGDNPFSYNNTDQQLKDNQASMDAELKQNDLLLSGHEDYEKRKAEITAKYNAQAITISNQNAQDQLKIFGDASEQLAGGVAAAFGATSGAAQAAYAVSKGITIAQTVLSIQSALAQALATPFPASLAAYAQVLSLGAQIISTAKGAAGQFHGGIDDLPAGYDNKSFVLKQGERVVQPEANKKLTKFLDNQNSGATGAGDTTINAPLIIQGADASDDAKFQQMLKKHANNVSQAVRQSQKRNS